MFFEVLLHMIHICENNPGSGQELEDVQPVVYLREVVFGAITNDLDYFNSYLDAKRYDNDRCEQVFIDKVFGAVIFVILILKDDREVVN